MPTAQMLTEEALPKYRAEDRDSDRIKTIYNYLFMLVEQLRYSLGNISEDNFNAASLDKIKSDISEPIYRRIEDSDGNISTLIQTAEMLQSRISNAEGDISTLTQTATSLSSRISDAEGNISNLTQTATSLSSRISDAEGNISSLTQTAGSLSSRISDAEGDISSLTQTAGSLSSRISSAEGSISSISQTVNGISLSVANKEGQSTIKLIRNGIAVSSETIVFSGFVRFTDLSTSGSTTINGNNITTGSISVDLIKPNSQGWIVFNASISAEALESRRLGMDENVEIVEGSRCGVSTIQSSYPKSIYMQSYDPVIFSQTPKVRSGNNFYDVITTANISDYISGVDLVAKFG